MPLKWMKRHKIMAGLLALMLTIIVPAFLNYSGMCIPEGRWLSDEEQLELALHDFRGWPDFNYLREHLTDSEIDDLRNDYEPVPYESTEDFKRENPRCCKVLGPDSDRPYWGVDSSARFFGSRANVIEMRYAARFRNKRDKNIVVFRDHVEYQVITNCGLIITRF